MKKLALPSFIVLISFCWLACQKKEESTIQIKSFPDWEAIASKLMERSDLVEGEKVILMAQPGSFDPLVPLLAEKIHQRGAIYLGTFRLIPLQSQLHGRLILLSKQKGKVREI